MIITRILNKCLGYPIPSVTGPVTDTGDVTGHLVHPVLFLPLFTLEVEDVLLELSGVISFGLRVRK